MSDLDRIKKLSNILNEDDRIENRQKALEMIYDMSETIKAMERTVRENGMLEKTLVAAAGMQVAPLTPLADMRKTLSDAYDACEEAYQQVTEELK